uniref:Endonuclease/exonuclease/phosphatase domain-containing protein n=1 Tax=Erpetoichthys calabaricus TaxID=27687 RepID=A0A8C4XBT5_ERPCA
MEKEEGWASGQHPDPIKTKPATETPRESQQIQLTSNDGGRSPVTVLEQNPSEAVQHPIHVSLFNAKTLTRIGTWNVLQAFNDYHLNILGLAEVRWAGSGRIISDGKTLLYSGHSTEHARGVGLVLSPQAIAALTESKPNYHCPLLIRQVKVTVIQIYAPTEESDKAAKQAFYDQLQDELMTVPRHDLLLVIGDFNAHLNGDRSGFEATMGPHGSGARTNDNGERLRSLCATNNLCIGNTVFQHKRIHKMTWQSPGGLYKKEIDYICVSKRWCSSLLDVKSQRGADVGSDHNLLVAKCRLKLMRSTPKPQRPRPFNVTKLKEMPVTVLHLSLTGAGKQRPKGISPTATTGAELPSSPSQVKCCAPSWYELDGHPWHMKA